MVVWELHRNVSVWCDCLYRLWGIKDVWMWEFNLRTGPLDSMVFVISVGNKIMRSGSSCMVWVGWRWRCPSWKGRRIKQTSFLRQECGRGYNVVRARFNQANAWIFRRLFLLSWLQKIIIYSSCEVHKMLLLLHIKSSVFLIMQWWRSSS